MWKRLLGGHALSVVQVLAVSRYSALSASSGFIGNVLKYTAYKHIA